MTCSLLKKVAFLVALAGVCIRPVGAADPSPLTPERQRALFAALDLTPAPLQPVAAAVASGDYAKADHALAEYLRHRAEPAWQFGQKKPTVTEEADDAVKGHVRGGLVTSWHTFPNNQIDWHYNETLATPGLAQNYEWQWQLCRMGFWGPLASAYRATHDEKYTHAWLTQLRSFVAQCPVPNHADNAAGSAWRTIEAGIRMGGSWPGAFFAFLPSPQFTDADIALYLDACLDHAHYLRQFQTRGNWVTMEMSGLYTVGAYFPEFKEAAEWRQAASQRMFHEETAQYLPDGAQFELSTMYHNVSLDNMLTVARVAKATNRLQELPEGYASGLEKAFDFNLWMMTPERDLPEFNDSTAWANSVVNRCKTGLDYFPGRTDFQWIASEGSEGHPPAATSHAFDWAGYYVMRSGWERDANYFVLRAGPLGAGHQHQDKLNVVLWSYGRQLLYNSGGASYEKSKWRTYSVEADSKNTVFVDGKGQVRDRNSEADKVSGAPIAARWESTPDHDFAAGVYDEGFGAIGERRATHTRRVLFIKPDLFVIADTLVPIDGAEHTYQARWNLLSTKTAENPQTRAVTTTDPGKSNLSLVPLRTNGLEVRAVSAQTEPTLLGWYVRKDSVNDKIPATVVLHTWKGTGTANFLTLLVPTAAGKSAGAASVKPTGPDGAVVTFEDGRKLTVAADPSPNGGLEVNETLPSGAAGRHVKVAPGSAATTAGSSETGTKATLP